MEERTPTHDEMHPFPGKRCVQGMLGHQNELGEEGGT